jgi:small conductance mechanosensitive channel
MKELLSGLNKLGEGSWQNIVLGYTIKILLAIFILAISFWLINRLVKFTNSFFIKRKVDSTVNSFFKTLIGSALKILVIIVVLNFIGIQTTSIIAIVGAAGLAIGLALQGTLTNFAGGVMLLLFKPFKPGDIIEVQGKKGKVKEMQIFNTILSTPENKTIIIPNSILSNGIIENHGKIKEEQKPV